MNARPGILLSVSAAVYFLAGVALLFAPAELATAAGSPASPAGQAVLQALGSALFGFAMLNWMTRHSAIGGLYGRPVVVANLAHAASAALLLGPLVRRLSFPWPLAIAAAIYLLLAVAFGYRFLTAPRRQEA